MVGVEKYFDMRVNKLGINIGQILSMDLKEALFFWYMWDNCSTVT